MSVPFKWDKNKHDVRSVILSILAVDFPLSAKTVYAHATKQHNLAVSYQAVHKALKQMETEGMVEKHGKEYRLNLEWINSQHEMFENIKFHYKACLSVDGESYLNENVRIFRNREETVENLIPITRRAVKGDIIFGHNRSGINYPPSLYTEFSRATKRGVKIRCVVPMNDDSNDFVNFLVKLGKNVEIKTFNKEYVRLYGIVGKEVMIALPFKDSYIALHFMDARMADYLYRAFSTVWKKSKPIVIRWKK